MALTKSPVSNTMLACSLQPYSRLSPQLPGSLPACVTVDSAPGCRPAPGSDNGNRERRGGGGGQLALYKGAGYHLSSQSLNVEGGAGEVRGWRVEEVERGEWMSGLGGTVLQWTKKKLLLLKKPIGSSR